MVSEYTIRGCGRCGAPWEDEAERCMECGVRAAKAVEEGGVSTTTNVYTSHPRGLRVPGPARYNDTCASKSTFGHRPR